MKNKQEHCLPLFCFLIYVVIISSGCMQRDPEPPNVTATTSFATPPVKPAPIFLCEKVAQKYSYTDLVDVNGTLYYVVADESAPLRSYIALESTIGDNSQITKRTTYSDQPAEIGQRAAFRMIQIDELSGPKEFIAYSGWYYGKKYESVSDPTDVAGKLAYIAEDEKGYFLVNDNVEEQTRYFSVSQLIEIDGKPAYTAGDEDGKHFIVYDGGEMGREYENASDPAGINGRLAYVAQKDGRRLVINDGKETGAEYDDAYSPAEVGGELAYLAQKDGKEFIVYDGKEIGVGYDRIMFLGQAQGQLLYVAQKGEVEFIVYQGKEGRDYDRITSAPVETAGSIVFAAKLNGKNCVIRQAL